MTSREDSVLAARDPSLEDENDWEEFSLSEVRILVPGKSRYANLLAASTDNPVQVTGCLDEVEDEQESLVLDDDYESKRIVLDNVTHYAYGQHNDGEVGIWVAGRAGWFSISPAKGYRPMFSEIVEAIDLLYFLADRHQQKRRKRKDWNPSVDYLCEEYVGHTHGICEDADDSLEVFHKHHGFLLFRMIRGEEGVRWTKTNLYAHLCETFPETYEQLKDENEAREKTPEQENETATPEKSHPIDPTLVSKGQAEKIYQVILELKDAGHLTKRQLNLELLTSTLVDQFSIDSTEYAAGLISARAKAVLDLMDEAKTANFDWSRKAIYRELKSASKRKKDVDSIVLTPLRPRANDDDDDDSSNEESEHEDLRRPRRRRVRKSVLRPKLSSVSTKQIGKRTRSAAAAAADEVDDYDEHDDNGNINDDDENEHDSSQLDDFETPSKRGGHELVRDPLSTRAKRARSILSGSSTPASIHRKMPLRRALHRNPSVSVSGDGAADSVDTDAITTTTNDALDNHNHDTSDMNGTMDTNGTTDTWTCQVQECNTVIEKCSSKRSQTLIQKHRDEHAGVTQEKLDLVFAEKELNIGLPVDNLLSRIRELGTGFSDILGANEVGI